MSPLTFNKYVALSLVVRSDPKFNLDGAETANEFWALHVHMTLVKNEDLVRCCKTYNILGNSEKTKIAFCLTFVCETSCLYHYLCNLNALCINSSFSYLLCRFRRYMDEAIILQ